MDPTRIPSFWGHRFQCQLDGLILRHFPLDGSLVHQFGVGFWKTCISEASTKHVGANLKGLKPPVKSRGMRNCRSDLGSPT